MPLSAASVRAGSGRESSHDIRIGEGGFSLKTLSQRDEREQGYRLRQDVFSRELGWVRGNGDGLERDDYDDDATAVGVFDRHGRLCAYLRLIPSPWNFMIEREFAALVGPSHAIRKENDTAEVSRLCVAHGERNRRIHAGSGDYTLTLFLYKGAYLWCEAHQIRYLYLVVEQMVFRLLNRQGFPCRPVGEPVVMPDGIRAIAAIMDWREFEAINASQRPELMNWFSRCLSAPSPSPPRLPEAFLPHRVYA